MPTESLVDRVIRKLRDEMTRQHLSQQDVADLWGVSQSRVAKLLNKRVVMCVSDLEALAFALSLSLTELVRQEGYEYVADLAPGELRILEAYRQQAQPTKDAIATLLRVSLQNTEKPPVFRARKK